jgi:protein SCO1/2
LTLARIIPLLLATALLAGCSPPPAPQLQQATLLPQPKPLAEFNLTDHREEDFTLEDLRGHWTLTFFGYTHCPDVCPTSLAAMAQVMDRLEAGEASGPLPRGLFVSVDPQRDTPQQLASYVPYFDPEFTGVTGDPEQIRSLTRQLGILYMKSGDSGGGDDYLIDHSAGIVLFDPDGRFHALFSVPHDPARIASDFLLIRNYYEAMQ